PGGDTFRLLRQTCFCCKPCVMLCALSAAGLRSRRRPAEATFVQTSPEGELRAVTAARPGFWRLTPLQVPAKSCKIPDRFTLAPARKTSQRNIRPGVRASHQAFFEGGQLDSLAVRSGGQRLLQRFSFAAWQWQCQRQGLLRRAGGPACRF